MLTKKKTFLQMYFMFMFALWTIKTPIDDVDQDDDRYLRKITGACWPTLTEVNEVSN